MCQYLRKIKEKTVKCGVKKCMYNLYYSLLTNILSEERKIFVLCNTHAFFLINLVIYENYQVQYIFSTQWKTKYFVNENVWDYFYLWVKRVPICRNNNNQEFKVIIKWDKSVLDNYIKYVDIRSTVHRLRSRNKSL